MRRWIYSADPLPDIAPAPLPDGFCEDRNYPAVSAASILAKVSRESNVGEIKQKIKVDFGSGYPADPMTIKFLKERGNKYLKYNIIRESWKTWKNLSTQQNQKKLF